MDLGFENTARWSRGVDTELFHPRDNGSPSWPRPIFLYVGRIAVEKNLEAFLRLELEGSKVLVGDGPLREGLQRRHPEAVFVGAKHGEPLARLYAGSDVFVFPSRTDTFGLVMIEALASGVPVAAYPVPGPLDVIGEAPVGVLDEELGRACRKALTIPRERCRQFALGFSWRACAERLSSLLRPVKGRA